MAFAAADLLAAIGADLFAAAGWLDRLAVDTSDARVGVAALALADPPAQGGKEAVPGAVAFPGLEVVVDGLPRREVMRQGTPGTALAGQVEEGVDHLPHRGFPGSAARPRRGDQRLQQGP